MTPEPMPTWRSCGMRWARLPKKKRNMGSSARGLSAEARLAVMLTTPGAARFAASA
jgi:hypothetical protein